MPFEKGIIQEGAKLFEKGKSGNLNGRPKGTISKKPKLNKLIKDLAAIMTTLTDREKHLAYQLYDIVENDLKLNNVSTSINHLYFIESDFGIKIGISKNVTKRIITTNERWNFGVHDFSFENQLKIIEQIHDFVINDNIKLSNTLLFVLQLLKNKIYGYYYQDMKKNKLPTKNIFLSNLSKIISNN